MRQYTVALASRIGHSALGTRTLFLSESAMQKGKFRYGRKARLVAGAALAIALRENQKGETMRDIAASLIIGTIVRFCISDVCIQYLLDESPVALARVFTSLIALLGVKLSSVDPSWHLPVLQRHLIELRDERSPPLPQNLIKVLQSIHLPSALRTAYSLSELISRAGILSNMPSPPTACAVYILALESEFLSSLPQLGGLARFFGIRFGVKEGVVMRRYKVVYEEVADWIADVPWLSQSDGTQGGSRSKLGKRASLARCLKDVIVFRERKWKTQLESSKPLCAPGEDDVVPVSSSEISSNNQVDLERGDEAILSHERPQASRASKRRKTHHLNDVATFLLSPLDAGTSSTKKIDIAASLRTASHILASESPFIDKPPTRLQQLAIERGADDIADEELFDDGELESFLRTADERTILRRTYDWACNDADSGEPLDRGLPLEDHRRYDNELLASFRDGPEDRKDPSSDDDDDNALLKQIGMTSGDPALTFNNELVVGPWRPLSPDNDNDFYVP